MELIKSLHLCLCIIIQQQQSSDDLSQKSNRYNESMNDYNRTKQTSKTRPNASRISDVTLSKFENKNQQHGVHYLLYDHLTQMIQPFKNQVHINHK